MSFRGLILPERHPPHTELLDLRPLPREALKEPKYVALYERKFTHFNAIQTQARRTAICGSARGRSPLLSLWREGRCQEWWPAPR